MPILTLAVLAGCVLIGPSSLGLPDTGTLTGRAILALRISRVACGFVVGAALAGAGVIFQAVLRNPLAEPYVLGVSGGSGLGAAFAIILGARIGPLALPLFAFAGGILTLLLVYALARSGGVGGIYGLILSGVIVSSICSSLLMFLIATAPVQGLHSILWWMLGSLQPASYALVKTSALLLVGAFAVGWLLTHALNALALGHENAHHVGLRLGFVIPTALATATFMTATAVSLAGIIGFVGLIVPHVSRRLFGADHRRLLPLAALFGGAFLALCDALARTVLAPVEIPVGVVTALLGGPFFLLILRRKHKQGWLA
jgi:iron complex transport system permease protein